MSDNERRIFEMTIAVRLLLIFMCLLTGFFGMWFGYEMGIDRGYKQGYEDGINYYKALFQGSKMYVLGPYQINNITLNETQEKLVL